MGAEEVEIENKKFFIALVEAVEEKPIVSIEERQCNCAPIYRIGIKEYVVILHPTHGIEIQQSAGGCVKTKLHHGIVDCSEEEMQELFNLLAEEIS